MMMEHIYTWGGTLNPFMLMAMGLAVFFLNFLPSIIAFSRQSEHRFIILILNIMLSWTGIVWLVLLVWAFQDAPESRRHFHS